MIQFYNKDIASTKTLLPEESHHCVKVLRHKIGDHIFVVDGNGSRYECEIIDDNRKGVRLEIVNVANNTKSWSGRIILAVAPTKNNDRMDWLVEKVVECGVDAIVPIECHNSERHVLKLDRLERIAVSAMKQSLKTILPELYPMMGFAEMAKLFDDIEAKYIGYCDNWLERKRFVDVYKPNADVVIAIGPEGDFSQAEIDTAVAAGFEAVTFGDERLRTETAALYGVVAAHTLNDLTQK